MKRIPVTKTAMPELAAYVEEISDLWDSRHLTNMGMKHEKLIYLLKNFLKTPYVSLFTNGHLALESVLSVFDLSGEVITTPYTFASTTHAIVRNGLVPVFCDIDPVTYTMDVSKIEELITDKTTAIVPVHVYGAVCDVVEIQKIADKYNLKVIYDAAHAFGVEVDGQGIGSYGDASMFSFHATKVFHTIEGGCVTFKDYTLHDKLNNVKNFGIAGPETVERIGGNAKMNEFQAAMGIVNFSYIEENRHKRRQIVDQYHSRLSSIPGLKLLAAQENILSNFAYFPVVFDGRGWDRDQVAYELGEHGVFARKYFYPLVSDFECYRDTYDSSQTPVAKDMASKVLTLPLYPELTCQDIDFICSIIEEMAPDKKYFSYKLSSDKIPVIKEERGRKL
ncbi:DegT/DnrJ/EryC1/StrS family aminotransferase [Alkalibacterium pelagium]|uniref:dTDP-4-amino-4,6-dideoxygalactose transaminase n=1 Tax=Alkalibacterium pelagium TaxID=426702 RepID=A0A1H7HNC0_9LACT|nr:DegT/DnrJ/EryC1/StrS family aminotransferase [Alkalibacterium pelagium]GEN50393.1 aminotransferase [Alkalibacterium pelagium]SEK51846.1 dTDP-4-amino-4,6-dideoxygalactose transaminase [Alkalibacterium pelagium]